MGKPTVTITIETSSHPDHDLVAQLRVPGGISSQMRGDRPTISAWVNAARISAERHGHPVEIRDWS